MISEDELRKEYTERILDLEKEAHGPLASKEALLSMMMGEGYRDPNYPKQIADPEFSDVAEIFNQWALSPPPKKYPGRTAGRVLSSKEMDLPLFNRLPNKEALGLSYLVSPGKPVSGLNSRIRGLHYPTTWKSTPDRVEYRGSGEDLANTIAHEFTHRVDKRSGYGQQLGKRLRDFVPKNNYWNMYPVYAQYFKRPLMEILAHSYAHKLGGGSLEDKEFKKVIKDRLENFTWKDPDKVIQDTVTFAPLLVADFEQYLREQEEENPTQLSRLVEIENELD
jgi:hypothetical protein